MNQLTIRCAVLALACLLAACQDRHGPVKPTVQAAQAAVSV